MSSAPRGHEGPGGDAPARGGMDGGPIAGIRKIAVLRGGGLGDLLFAFPAIRALQATYPDAAITLLGSRTAPELLRGRTGVPDRVVVLPPVPGVSVPPHGRVDRELIAAFLETERAEAYDLAVQVHGGGRYSNPLLLELRARHTVGTRTPDAAALDRSIEYVYYQHEMLRALEVVGLVGAVPVEVEPHFRMTSGERAFGLTYRGGPGPVVAVHPGATDPRRRWPGSFFGETIAVLAREGIHVIIVGTAAERDMCASVHGEAMRRLSTRHSARVSDTAGTLSLSQLAGVLGCADLLLGNDSGPRHLAQALGTPTASIYWFGNLITAGPLTRQFHRVQISWTTRCPECGRDCTQVGWTAQRCEHDSSFVGDVPVDAVLGDVRSLLSLAGRTPRDT